MSRPDVTHFLARHFVNLCWIDETPGDRRQAHNGKGTPFTTSGFIISVSGKWFLITAGHVLKDIEKARQTGQRLTNFALKDTWSIKAKHPSMPFDFDGSWKWFADISERGLDYGVIQLRDNVCDLLTANGAEPIFENGWKKIPAQIEEWYLLGTPSPKPRDINDVAGGLSIRRSVVFFRVLRLKRRPKGHRAPWIYCTIANPLRERTTGEQLEDIDGMSGCPLIGVAQDKKGIRRYYCVGIQSGWLKDSRLAFACPLKPLGDWLEIGVERAVNGDNEPTPAVNPPSPSEGD